MPDEKSPALASFAQQVEALREARMPPKVGVMIATYMRPDLLRSCVAQFALQSRQPDIICVHQNGVSDSYRWAVEDLAGSASTIAWLHTAVQIPQHQWYSIPLQYLVEQGCSHIFWAHDGDLYLRTHIERGLEDLRDFDFSAPARGGLLLTHAREYRHEPDFDFATPAPDGVAPGICFNRKFARQLLADLEADAMHIYTRDVIAQVTCPGFRCRTGDSRTVVRHRSSA